ncbi:MAG: ROK family transcriptional regulator [Oscillospiraceae bacterium]|nr:ROK family transcriptional regulator [Oscillospiraceae bacterium]
MAMETKGISKLDLKRRNRKQILLAIRRAGMLARVDIAAKLSLTRAAVTIITNQMIAQNILEDLNSPLPAAADEPKKKGRRKTMIRINPTYRYILGAVIEEDHVCIGLSNLALEPVAQECLPLTDSTDLDEIVSFIVTASKRLVKKASLNAKQVLGLGVGIVPSRWEQMRAEKDEDEQVHFSKLCYLLEMELSLPVCAANAISLYAMANIGYGADACAEQLLLYGGANFHFATVADYALVGGIFANTALVDRIILCPGGEKAKGFPEGSVHAEMATPIVLKRMKKETGKEWTVDEANQAYTDGNEKIVAIMNEQLRKLATLIYNLCIGHRTSKVVLQKFRINDAQRAYLAQYFETLSPDPSELKIVYSPIDGDREFLAGCSLAAEKQFFELGGLQPSEKMM